MTNLFLSYGREDDEPFLHRLYDALSAKGLSVWFDRKSMPVLDLIYAITGTRETSAPDAAHNPLARLRI